MILEVQLSHKTFCYTLCWMFREDGFQYKIPRICGCSIPQYEIVYSISLWSTNILEKCVHVQYRCDFLFLSIHRGLNPWRFHPEVTDTKSQRQSGKPFINSTFFFFVFTISSDNPYLIILWLSSRSLIVTNTHILIRKYTLTSSYKGNWTLNSCFFASCTEAATLDRYALRALEQYIIMLFDAWLHSRKLF